MRTRALLYSVGFLLLLILVGGCGGGGGGGGSDEGVGASLTFHTNTVLAPKAASDRIVLGAPLDEGGAVTVYNFLTGEVILTGLLDSAGTADLDVPGGMTVAVVVNGTQGGKAYRLSIVIPSVPIEGGDYFLDAATSIAAETLAQEYFGKQVISDDTWEQVLSDAEDFVDANLGDDFSLEGTTITGTASDFGEAGGLGADAPDITVPEETNGVALAKIAVQQIKEAGNPLSAMVGDEPGDINGLVTEELMDKYGGLGDRLSELIIPAIDARMVLDSDPTNRIAVFDLTVGEGYAVADTDGDGNLVLVDSNANDVPGQVTIVIEDLKLVAKLSGGIWTLTQTSTVDAAMDYVVTVPAAAREEPGANPSFTATVSLEDEEFTTPITFNGSLSAQGPDPDHYSRWEFDGTLTGPNFNSQGDLVATFVSSLPDGADPEDSIYDYPTSFSLTDGQFSVTNEDTDTTIAVTGDISAEAEILDTDDGPDVFPTRVSISGTYSNSHSGLSFSGNITGNWSNPPEGDIEEIAGSLRMQGQLIREGHPTYSADLQFTISGGEVDSSIDLAAGGTTLAGTASLTMDTNGEPHGASLTLTNQAGVVFDIDWDTLGEPTGTVKVGSATVANIALSPDSDLHKRDLYRITYLTTPETYDEL